MKFYRKYRKLFYVTSLMMFISAILSLHRGDKAGAIFNFAVAFIFAFSWSTSYYRFSDGKLARYICGLRMHTLTLSEIAKVYEPRVHRKWAYGSTFGILTASGGYSVIQPERSEEFLDILRREAPQAEFTH